MRKLSSFLCALLAASTPAAADSLDEAIATIRKVDAEGAGNEKAAAAWETLSTAQAGDLPRLLAGLDGANVLAANWLRANVDAVAEKTLAGGQSLPLADLEAFLQDRRHDPRARRLAYDWIAKADKTSPERWIPRMLDDPSVELRRDAVARVLEQATAAFQKDDKDKATQLYSQAFDAARDEDQVKTCTEKLKQLGKTVDLATHYGFLMNWRLIGPFEGSNKTGFGAVHPPEKEVRFDASYPGRGGSVKWIEYATADANGVVNLNKALGKHKGAVAYAASEFDSEKGGPVELRLGCINAWKVWVNGQPIFGREEYHSGMYLDQYRLVANLKPGKNVILLKIVQNEQTESWAQRWAFQLRVCDPAGTAVLSTSRPPTKLPAPDAKKNDGEGDA